MTMDRSNVPALEGFALPAEWARHARTWMAWPARPATWHGGIEAARMAHVELAKALAAFEPVTIVCSPAEMAEASLMCGPGIELAPMPLSDGWMRDIGPTFVTDRSGRIAGIDWIFNGWGGLHNEFVQDALVRRGGEDARLSRLQGADRAGRRGVQRRRRWHFAGDRGMPARP
jgi:agmatine deiminase